MNELFKSFLRNKTTTRETGMSYYLSMNTMWIFETFKDMFHLKNNQNISNIQVHSNTNIQKSNLFLFSV